MVLYKCREKKGSIEMNKLILVKNLTKEQKQQVMLTNGKTWEDVIAVNFQLRKDGTIANYSVDYKAVATSGHDITDAMNLLFADQHSKSYQSAKKRANASNEQINSARRLLK